MYNIHSHYENIASYIKHKITNFRVAYLFPFGSSNFSNIETIDYSSGSPTAPVFFCYDQEPLKYSYNKNLFKKISSLSIKKSTHIENSYITVFSETYCTNITFKSNLKFESQVEQSPVILLNTEKNSDEKNKLLSQFPFIDCYFFFHALAAADWYRGYRYCPELVEPAHRKINKKFITFNRITGNSRVYRSFFIAELYKKNLLNKGHISYSKICPEHGHYNTSLLESKKYGLTPEYIKSTYNIIDQIDDLRIDSPKDKEISNGSYTIGGVAQSMESFLHVVTETCFWDRKCHLTEKIFKPIVLKQPFILLGCAHNLSYLKEYGFKTFDRWFDESYDNITDPIERLHKVCNVIEQLSAKSDHELEQMLIDMQEVLDYNYNWFYNQDFLDLVWNELITNLDQAIAQLPLQN